MARAGNEGIWPSNSPESICQHANSGAAESDFKWGHKECRDGFAIGSAPVGSFIANKFGLHDVIGNVAEWVQDCVNLSYVDAPANGGVWEKGLCASRVVRGGSWFSGLKDLRLSARARLGVRQVNDFTGFRVVREIDE